MTLSLDAAVRSVAHAAAKSDDRPALTNVVIDKLKNVAWAADGFMLAYTDLNLDGEPTTPSRFIKVAGKLMKRYGRNPESAWIDDGSAIFLTTDGAQVSVPIEQRDDVTIDPTALFPKDAPAASTLLSVDLLTKTLAIAKQSGSNAIAFHLANDPMKPVELVCATTLLGPTSSRSVRVIIMPMVMGDATLRDGRYAPFASITR